MCVSSVAVLAFVYALGVRLASVAPIYQRRGRGQRAASVAIVGERGLSREFPALLDRKAERQDV